MFCPKCGTDNQDGVKFCKKCGASMIEGGAELATNAAKTAVQERSGSEKAALVLGIVAAALLFIPIPLLAWFSVPCAVVGFIFSFMLWLQAEHDDAVPSIHTVIGIVLCAFVMLHFLAGTISGTGDLVSDLLSNIANGFGTGLSTGLH